MLKFSNDNLYYRIQRNGKADQSTQNLTSSQMCVLYFKLIIYLLIHYFLPSLSYCTKELGGKYTFIRHNGRKIKYISLPSNFSTTSRKIPDLNKILNTILASDSFERFKKWIKHSHMSLGFTKVPCTSIKQLPSLLLKGPFKALSTYKAAEQLLAHSDCTFWLILSV